MSLLLFLLALQLNGQTQFICKYPEKMYKQADVKYPGEKNIDVKYYSLDLSINTDAKILYGTVAIRFEITGDEVSEIFFDFDDNMKVDSIKTSFNSLPFEHNFDKIKLTKPGNFIKGVTYEAEIYYHGTPVPAGFGGFLFDSYKGSPWVWTLSEPYAASTWWPCKNDPSDKADSAQIRISVAKDLIAVSNGKLIADEFVSPGNRRFTWKTNYPIANYLIAVTVGEFNVYSDYFHYAQSDSMLVINYLLEQPNALIETYTNITLDMLDYFSEIFGEYPFLKEKYGHVEFGFSGGMEHQTITSLGSWGEGIIAHELAHQWFGNKITCADWHEIWLNEGFAQYSESLYREHAQGFEAYLERIAVDMNNALRAQGSVYATDISNARSIFDLYSTYAKGAVVLHMLRGVVGDAAFFKILKTYANDPELSYSNATTDNFKNIAESLYGEDLDWFFEEWIYGEKFPDYDYAYEIKDEGGSSKAFVRVIQYPTGEENRLFKMPVQLKFIGDDADTTVTAMIDSSDNNFEYRLNFSAKEMIFDPNNFVLKRSGEIPFNNKEAETYFLMQNYPNPFNGRTVITFSVAIEAKVKLEVFNLLGQKIAKLVDEELSPGLYVKEYAPRNISSGVLVYRLTANGVQLSKKMLYLK